MNATTRLQIARQIVRAIRGYSLDYGHPGTIAEIESWEQLLNVSPEKPSAQTVRVLRLIEYVGTPAFVQDCINRRSLKGTKVIPHMGFMREAIIGETAEFLSDRDFEVLSVCRPKTT